jgi:Endosomal/lysosomal potassium channel TMEM175
MSTTKQETRRAAKPRQDSLWPHVRLSETARLETFSDRCPRLPSRFRWRKSCGRICIGPAVGEADRAMEPAASRSLHHFVYAGVIWLNHRSLFARVRYCDRSLHLANLFLLLTSALIPFPTAILSAAIHSGNELNAKVAVTLCSHCRVHLPRMASRVPRSKHTSISCGGRCSPDFFPKERFAPGPALCCVP